MHEILIMPLGCTDTCTLLLPNLKTSKGPFALIPMITPMLNWQKTAHYLGPTKVISKPVGQLSVNGERMGTYIL